MLSNKENDLLKSRFQTKLQENKEKAEDNYEIAELKLIDELDIPKFSFLIEEKIAPVVEYIAPEPTYSSFRVENSPKEVIVSKGKSLIKNQIGEIVKEKTEEKSEESDDGVLVVDQKMVQSLRSIWN